VVMHRMTVLVLGLVGVSALPVPGQPANDGGCECVEELSVPAYTPLALNSRTQGKAQIRVTLDESATPATIEIREVSELLKPPIRAAIQDWIFKRSCKGKTVYLTMQYRVRTESTITRQTIRFRPPCQFVIDAPAGSLDAKDKP